MGFGLRSCGEHGKESTGWGYIMQDETSGSAGKSNAKGERNSNVCSTVS